MKNSLPAAALLAILTVGVNLLTDAYAVWSTPRSGGGS